jgi:hypothetical protein
VTGITRDSRLSIRDSFVHHSIESSPRPSGPPAKYSRPSQTRPAKISTPRSGCYPRQALHPVPGQHGNSRSDHRSQSTLAERVRRNGASAPSAASASITSSFSARPISAASYAPISPTTTPHDLTNRSTTTVPTHGSPNASHVAGSSPCLRSVGSIIATSASPDRGRALRHRSLTRATHAAIKCLGLAGSVRNS